MKFDLAGPRTASILLAVAATLSACGGGSSDPTSPSVDTQQDTSTSSATTSSGQTSSGSTTAVSSTDTTSNSASTSTVTSNPAAPVDSSTANTPATTTSAPSTPVDTTTVASADTSSTATSTTVASVSGSAGTEAVLAPTLATNSAPAASRSGVGVNLAGIYSYSSQIPTLDFMKKASPWITQCTDGTNCANFTGGANGYDTLEETQLDLDADGWVKSLPAASSSAKYRMVTTKITEGAGIAGNYTVVYDGSGTITYLQAGTKVASLSKPGRDIVAVTNNNNNPFYLRITATDPTNYIRNIRVYPPGGACANAMNVYVESSTACTATTGKFVAFENFPAGFTWHPAMLASLKGFRSLRFMDWGMTNATPVVNWSERTPATARTWYSTKGVPLEAMFDLAGKVGADPWMNIPPYANDAYVHSFAQFAHAHLAAGQKLAIEYGNEMWNYAFPAAKWGVAQSKLVFPTQTAAGVNAGVLYLNWYALRSAQVCQIMKSEFGADASRVQCVANTQAANSWATDQVLSCTYAQSLLGKQCSKYFDAVAIAPYFGYYIGSGSTTATVNAWTTNSDGGLNSMFLELTGLSTTGTLGVTPLATLGAKSTKGAIDEVAGWMVANAAVAKKYGLPMWAYEGGQGLIPPAGNTSVTNLMFAANRDPRMGAAYQTMLTDWKNAGGQTFMLFSDVGRYAASGMWGLRETMFDTSAPKWQAAVNWRDNVRCWWTGC